MESMRCEKVVFIMSMLNFPSLTSPAGVMGTIVGIIHAVKITMPYGSKCKSLAKFASPVRPKNIKQPSKILSYLEETTGAIVSTVSFTHDKEAEASSRAAPPTATRLHPSEVQSERAIPTIDEAVPD
jgi:hypothetical protein